MATAAADPRFFTIAGMPVSVFIATDKSKDAVVMTRGERAPAVMRLLSDRLPDARTQELPASGATSKRFTLENTQRILDLCEGLQIEFPTKESLDAVYPPPPRVGARVR